MRAKVLASRIRRLQEQLPAPQGYMTIADWQRLQDVIVAALEPFPDARYAVAEALIQEDITRRAYER